MRQVIENNADALVAAQRGDWTAAAAAMAADLVAVEDHTLRTTRWLMMSLPDQAAGMPAGTSDADVVLATLQGSDHPRVRAAYDAMSATGIDLADPQVQRMVPVLAASGGWPDGLADKVLTAGVKQVSKWEQAAGTAPTAETVQAAWEAGQVTTYDKRSMQLSVNRRSNGKTAVNVRLRHVGLTAGGAESQGHVETLAVADASQPLANEREKALIDAVTAAVEAYIAGGA